MESSSTASTTGHFAVQQCGYLRKYLRFPDDVCSTTKECTISRLCLQEKWDSSKAQHIWSTFSKAGIRPFSSGIFSFQFMYLHFLSFIFMFGMFGFSLSCGYQVISNPPTNFRAPQDRSLSGIPPSHGKTRPQGSIFLGLYLQYLLPSSRLALFCVHFTIFD